MTKPIHFLGRTLEPHCDGKSWSNGAYTEPLPWITVGRDVSGTWFAFVNADGLLNMKVTGAKSRPAALRDLGRQLKTLRDQLNTLELK